jgi:hypothetical protein
MFKPQFTISLFNNIAVILIFAAAIMLGGIKKTIPSNLAAAQKLIALLPSYFPKPEQP